MQMKRPPPSPHRPRLSPVHQNFNNSPYGNNSISSNGKIKNGQNSNSVLGYIKSAAKKVAGILTLSFLFKPKPTEAKSITPSRSRRASSSYEFSSGSYSKASTSYSKASSKPQLSESFGGSFAGPTSSGQIGAPNFTFEEINKATHKFAPENKLGEGGFGAVYKGRLDNGLVIAVKRAKKNVYDRVLSAEFKNEIVTLSMIEHLNLVRLYGYLEHGDERIIVVEYIGNGTLRDHLDGTRGDGLEMAERLDIAIDIAHAITYLHNYTDPPIIHRDIKATNILITEKLRAKVADFGFARQAADEDNGVTHISTQVKGTAGYLDPEYLRTYQLTDKSDVYSFGVLLVEMVTGRHPIDTKRRDSERLTARWAMQKLKQGDFVHVMDQRLRRNPASTLAAEKMLKLAQQCLAPLRQSRPSMKKCVEDLWAIRKEIKDKALSPNTPPLFHYSSDFTQTEARKTRNITFGIQDEDSYKFISA